MALLLLATLLAPGPPGAAASVTVQDAELPSGRYGTAAAWVDGRAYVVGGQMMQTLFPDILRYDPATDAVTTMQAELPQGMANVAAATDGSHVYLFGGWAGLAPDTYQSIGSDKIWRYDPAADQLTEMAARLPQATWHVQAVWTGSYFLLLGGEACGEPCPVLRYDPVADEVRVQRQGFPYPVVQGAAVWDGENAYYLGGRQPGSQNIWHSVWRYNFTNDQMRLLDERLERPVMWGAGFWDGEKAYVAGGHTTNGTRLAVVQSWDPVTRAAATPYALPQESGGLSATWGVGSAFLFGAGIAFKQVLELDTPGPGPGGPAAGTTGPQPTPTGPSDQDGDGVIDSEDNCPATPNPDQGACPTPAPSGTADGEAVAGPEPVSEADDCDPTPHTVRAGVGAPFGRNAWVQWQRPDACPWPVYQVFDADGTLLGEKVLAEIRVYTFTFPPPEAGEHVLYVQAARGRGAELQAESAASVRLAVAPAAQTAGPADDGADEEPVGNTMALLVLGGLVVALLAGAGVLVVLRRRRGA